MRALQEVSELSIDELRALARAAATPLGFLGRLGGATRCLWPGRDRGRRRVVLTLLHGNEPSGTVALWRLLRGELRPAVDVLLLFGAVTAALAPPGFAQRARPGGRDLNRCFLDLAGEDGALAAAILAAIDEVPFEALWDLHNNTGHNPLYGVVTEADAPRRGLVSLFGERCVQSHLRLGTVLDALAARSGPVPPAVTIECGRAGDPAADDAAEAGLARALTVERIPGDADGLQLFAAPLRLELCPDARVIFGTAADPAQDLVLLPDLDRHNFSTMPVGEPLGHLGPRGVWPLRAIDERGVDVSRERFGAIDGRLVVREALVPIMMTCDLRAAAADCLCYLVHPVGAGGL